jgi:hypothetical protein
MKQTGAITMNSPRSDFHKNTQIKSKIKETIVISPQTKEINKYLHAVGKKYFNTKK